MLKAYVIAYALNLYASLPNQDLRSEEVLPYIARVLRDPTDWSIHLMGLLCKSRLERRSPKTVQVIFIYIFYLI